MRLRDDDGRELEAEIALTLEGSSTLLTIESRGGGSGSARPVNPDYIPGFRLALKRAKQSGWTVVDAFLASRPVEGRSEDERRILDQADYPASGTGSEIADRLRKEAGRMFRRPGATGAGNATKRIQVRLKHPNPKRSLADDLRSFDEPYPGGPFVHRYPWLRDQDGAIERRVVDHVTWHGLLRLGVSRWCQLADVSQATLVELGLTEEHYAALNTAVRRLGLSRGLVRSHDGEMGPGAADPVAKRLSVEHSAPPRRSSPEPASRPAGRRMSPRAGDETTLFGEIYPVLRERGDDPISILDVQSRVEGVLSGLAIGTLGQLAAVSPMDLRSAVRLAENNYPGITDRLLVSLRHGITRLREGNASQEDRDAESQSTARNVTGDDEARRSVPATWGRRLGAVHPWLSHDPQRPLTLTRLRIPGLGRLQREIKSCGDLAALTDDALNVDFGLAIRSVGDLHAALRSGPSLFRAADDPGGPEPTESKTVHPKPAELGTRLGDQHPWLRANPDEPVDRAIFTESLGRQLARTFPTWGDLAEARDPDVLMMQGVGPSRLADMHERLHRLGRAEVDRKASRQQSGAAPKRKERGEEPARQAALESVLAVGEVFRRIDLLGETLQEVGESLALPPSEVAERLAFERGIAATLRRNVRSGVGAEHLRNELGYISDTEDLTFREMFARHGDIGARLLVWEAGFRFDGTWIVRVDDDL